MTMHSRDTRENPGIKRAYLELPSTLEGTQSYCITIPGGLDNKKRLIDLLTITTRWYSWERSAGTEGKETADRWRDVLNLPELNMCCCPEPTNRRYDSEGNLEVSYDGGITWVDAPELDDRFSGIVSPPMPGTDGEEKRCIAAASGEEYVKLNLIEDLNEGSNYAELNAALVAIVAALGVTGIGILIAAAAAAIFIAGVSAVQAAFTTEVWTAYRCILFCHIKNDGSFDEAGWNAVKADILDQFTGVVSAILYNWVNSVGVVGLTNAARSGFVASADCSGCEDCLNCYSSAWIITGSLVDAGDGWIEIQAGVADYGPAPYMIAFGSSGVPDYSDYCCQLCGIEILSGTQNGAAYRLCNGTPVLTQVPTDQLFSVMEWGFNEATATMRFTFEGSPECP